MAKKGNFPHKNYYWEMLLKEVNNQDANQATYFYLPKKTDKDSFFSKKIDANVSEIQLPLNKRHHLAEPFTHIYLTTREAETLRAVIQEKTLLAAAKKLQLSARTIEFYFENIKKKLNCRKKKDVLALVREYKLIDT